MDGASAPHRVHASLALRALATRCIEARQGTAMHAVTLDEIIPEALRIASEMVQTDPTSLRDHLSAQPADGNVPIEFELDGQAETAFERLRSSASELVGYAVGHAETVSIALFADLVRHLGDAAATAVNAKHGAALARSEIGDQSGNKVVRFGR